MFSNVKKLFKRGSGKNENAQTQTDKNKDNTDIQDGSTFTSVKVIELQHKSKKLVSTLQRIVKRLGLGPGTWDLGPGTWDMGHGTWDLGPRT